MAIWKLTIEDDEASTHELHKLVAFHARSLGAEGRPASLAMMQIELLGDALHGPEAAPLDVRTSKVLREIARIVADSHALGAMERAKFRHQLEIRDFSPVIRLGETTVVGFLLGAMERELIDAMIGRLLREAARTNADQVILDCFGAARDNETFHRTIQSFMKHEVGCRIHLTLSGLRDTDATRTALTSLGCNLERLQFEPDINTAIAAAMTRIGPLNQP
jgi:hypothetical protein